MPEIYKLLVPKQNKQFVFINVMNAQFKLRGKLIQS
ncbi:unnamed protein product [Schistosoma mattheei]|uniref:Uncharacterized protein n=1 Tax=Schistosoma mattheei TaxID=31246 RepID=A0A3P8BXF4_9TREM|nr:unnamed protein product [Schistosoma mattheei]